MPPSRACAASFSRAPPQCEVPARRNAIQSLEKATSPPLLIDPAGTRIKRVTPTAPHRTLIATRKEVAVQNLFYLVALSEKEFSDARSAGCAMERLQLPNGASVLIATDERTLDAVHELMASMHWH